MRNWLFLLLLSIVAYSLFAADPASAAPVSAALPFVFLLAVRPLKDVDTWVNDMIEGVNGSARKYADGRLNPRRDPKTATLAAVERQKAGVLKANANDSFRKGVEKADFSVTEEAATREAQKLIAGVTDRREKIRKKITKLHPLLAAHKTAMDALVVKSDADAESKMLKNLAGMRKIGEDMLK